MADRKKKQDKKEEKLQEGVNHPGVVPGGKGENTPTGDASNPIPHDESAQTSDSSAIGSGGSGGAE